MNNKKIYFLLLLVLLLHFFLLLVLKFTAWPEMLLWPYLIIKGWLPYRDIAIAHTPLMLFDLSLFYKLFGVGIFQLKLFTWGLILLFDLLIFLVVKKIWNEKAAILSVIFYSLWMLFYDGNGLWFDLYMGILAFCSFYFVQKGKWFWAGVFWSLAFLSKQTAVWFLIPILHSIIVRLPLKGRNLTKFMTSSLVVFSLFLLLIYFWGILPDFWNWAVKFGIFILPKSQGQVLLPSFKTLLVSLFPFSIFLFLFINCKSKITNLVLWAIAGFMGAYPRFELFHFQPAIFYLAIFLALVVFKFKSLSLLSKSFLVLYFSFSFYLFFSFLTANYKKGVRFYEEDVIKVVSYLKEKTFENEKILVLNWWDNIYPLTGTLPAISPWVPQLPWYQNLSGIQEKEISDLEIEKPRLVLVYPYSNSGLSSFVPEKLFNFIKENYDFKEKVGSIEVFEIK